MIPRTRVASDERGVNIILLIYWFIAGVVVGATGMLTYFTWRNRFYIVIDRVLEKITQIE